MTTTSREATTALRQDHSTTATNYSGTVRGPVDDALDGAPLTPIHLITPTNHLTMVEDHEGSNGDRVAEMVEIGWSQPPAESLPTDDLASFLSQARPLEPSTYAATPNAASFIDTLAAEIIAAEASTANRRRPRGPKETEKVQLATGALVGALLRHWGRDTPSPVAIDQSNEGLGELPGGRIAARTVIDGLRAGGLLEFKPGVRWLVDHGFTKFFTGRLARAWPTPALLQRASEAGLSPGNIKTAFLAPWPNTVPDVPQAVKVRGIKGRGQKEGQPMPSDVLEPSLGALVAEVTAWNEFAATVAVTECRPPRWFRSFGPDARLGGRWYSAGTQSYQSMPESSRLDIKINGQDVAEADAKAAHLSIMHGLLGLPLPEGDPYAIDGTPREVVKAWIVATLGKGSPTRRWRSDADEAVTQYDATKIGAAICHRYPFLRAPAKAVARAAGLNSLAHLGPPEVLLTHRLQAIEAEAITRAMRQVRDRFGLLSLPVHDSLIVPASIAEKIGPIMADAFEDVAGARVKVDVDLAGRLR